MRWEFIELMFVRWVSVQGSVSFHGGGNLYYVYIIELESNFTP